MVKDELFHKLFLFIILKEIIDIRLLAINTSLLLRFRVFTIKKIAIYKQ